MRRREPALVFVFITLFLDILGIGLVVPILPKLIESLAGGGVDGPPTSTDGSPGSMP